MKLLSIVGVALLVNSFVALPAQANHTTTTLYCELSVPDNAEIEWENVTICEEGIKKGLGTLEGRVHAALDLAAYYRLQSILRPSDIEKSTFWLTFASQNWPDESGKRVATASVAPMNLQPWLSAR